MNTPQTQSSVGSTDGSALKTAVSQVIQGAIAAHVEEYSKLFPEQVWGKGALHARLLPAVMSVLPNVQSDPAEDRLYET